MASDLRRCRPSPSYMASYLGSDKDEYEVINSGRTPRAVGDGYPAWEHISTIRGDYDEIQRWVDVENLVDYMLLNF